MNEGGRLGVKKRKGRGSVWERKDTRGEERSVLISFAPTQPLNPGDATACSTISRPLSRIVAAGEGYQESKESPPLPSFPLLSLRRWPPKIQLGGLGKRCKLPQRGQTNDLVHSSLKIQHLVATILIRINWPSFCAFYDLC